MSDQRDLLFISYAWEDAPTAQWLARKLTTFGYKVWMDKLQLFGGCGWPKDIDDAIKNRSCHMLHLLSKYSIAKPNPSAERQLGLTMSKQIKNYLIPLNLEGIPPDKLPWQLTEIQYIDFQDWSCGFKDLLKTLQKCNCPVFDIETGTQQAISSYLPLDAIKRQPETLYSNVHEILESPTTIKRFKSNSPLLRDEFEKYTRGAWIAYYINRYECLSFSDPPASVIMLSNYTAEESYKLDEHQEIDGIPTRNIQKSLFLKIIYALAKARGFYSDSNNNLVFPGLKENARFYNFVSYYGSSVKVAPHGYKTIHGKRINYSLAFKPRIAVIEGAWCVIISLHLHLSDIRGMDIDRKFIQSLRKHIVKSWWNHEWFVRHMAISAWLSEDSENWSYQLNETERLLVSRMPMTGISETSLDDATISLLAKERQQKSIVATDDDIGSL